MHRVELIRSQVDKTELGPREEDGLDAILHGAVARILIFSDLIFCEHQEALLALGAEGLSTVSKRNEAAGG